MVQAMMRIDMVYQFPIWAVGLSLAVAAVIGTIVLELVVRRFVSADFRRQHNDIAAAIFSIIGVTYAVLLAFVAMLAWEGFNKAKAASYSEAALVLDVYQATEGLSEPARANLIDDLTRYTKAVAAIEWPAQAEGHVARAGDRYLDDMHRLAVNIRPSGQGDANLHAMLLQSLTRLRDARQERLLAAETTIPGIVWFVVIVGGTITIIFGLFLGCAERADASQHVLLAGCLRGVGAGSDNRTEQSVPRRLPGLDRPVRIRIVADRGRPSLKERPIEGRCRGGRARRLI